MSQPQIVNYQVRCRLCPQVFQHPAFVPVVGQGIDKRNLMQLGTALVQHIFTKHQEQMGAFLILVGFMIQDPLLIETLDPLRFAIASSVRKNFVSDAELQDKLAALGCSKEDLDRLLPFVQDLRDFLTESGRHAVQPPSSLVTP